MLKKIYVDNISSSHKIFEEIFSDTNSTVSWIVSDLTSKLSFQEKLFQKTKVIPDESLLRAQELWSKVFLRNFSDYKIVSNEFSLFFIQDFLKEYEQPWAQRKGVSKLAINYMTELMPVLTHNDGHEIMKEFFKSQVPSYERWGHWYLLCAELFLEFKKNKMILNSWIPFFLLQEDSWDWDKDLIFDLGSQLQSVEAELIQKISRTRDCTVIVPNAEWLSQYEKVLIGYQLLGEIYTNQKKNYLYSNTNSVFKKYSTQLAEVQAAMVSLRKWIQIEGISPSQIAITAPDIGVYWPVLSSYFKIEGVASNRPETASYKNIPTFQKWISGMKVACGSKNFSDLETSLYTLEDQIPVSYDPFASQYQNFYSTEEIKNPLIQNTYSLAEQNKLASGSLLEFVDWALQFWKSQDSDMLQNILNRAYQSFPLHICFSFLDWIEIFEYVLGHLETTVREANSLGIRCLDLISLKDVPVQKVIYLGLSDSAVRKTSSTLIQESDIHFLKTQYGISIHSTEKADLEFEVLWNLQNKERQSELFYSSTDFQAQEQAPSRVWFLGAIEQNEKSIQHSLPETHRLIQLQRNFSFSESLTSEFLKRDMGEIEHIWQRGLFFGKLSASQIEDYLCCPFVNAAKKIFKLADLPTLDLDIDYLTRGVILHKVAEEIFKNHQNLELKDSQILEMLDSSYLLSKDKIKDPFFWKNQRVVYFQMIKRFIKFEKSLRLEFPNLKSSFFEQEFSLHVCSSTGDVIKDKSKLSEFECVEIRGRIDRIDTDDQDELAVAIDYKYDHSSYKNYSKWIESLELQLLLYMYAIENGILGSEYRVVGSLYYGFKTATRAKGFLDEEVDGILFKTSGKKNKSNSEVKNKLYLDLKRILVEVISKMTDGRFEPNPVDIKECASCKWRKICRAPHLN